MRNICYTLSEIERQIIAENELFMQHHIELARAYACECFDANNPNDEILAFNQMRKHSKSAKSYEVHTAQIHKWAKDRENRIRNDSKQLF